MKKFSLLLGGLLAAVAASSCCILPLLLGAASAGTVGLGAALAPYRPYLMALTALLLGAAFYGAYRPVRAACDADGNCSSETAAGAKRLSRAVIWVVTLFTVGAMAYPEIAARRADEKAPASFAAAVPETAKTALFTVGKMTCADCTVSITKALTETPGVFEASVDFKTKRATVRYDPSRVNVATLYAAIEGTGYPAAEVAPGNT